MKIDVETKIAASRAASAHRIFLVDPDVINRSKLYFMLANANETHELGGIADIANMNARLVPDLVIVNALLVAQYGKALIQGWRIAWPGVKVLVICEACDADCEIAAKAAGADDTLLRPFKLEAVQRKVDRWMERPKKHLADLNIPVKRKHSSLHVRH